MQPDEKPCPDLGGEAFCPLPAWARVLMSAGPLAAFVLVLGWLYFELSREAVIFLIGAALGGFAGGGKLVVLAGAVENAPFGTWILAGLVVYSDVAAALFLLANLQTLYRVPFIGRRLAAAREAGYRVLSAHGWMRRMAWLGLVVFIALPLQGTGALLGVFLGRILGLARPSIVAATGLGAAAGASGVAALGDAGREQITWLTDHPEVGLATAALTVALTYFLGRKFLKMGAKDASVSSS